MRIFSREIVHGWIDQGKISYARNGSVIVRLSIQDVPDWDIEAIITSFRIHQLTYEESKTERVVDPQTVLTWQRPSSGKEHWHNARERVSGKNLHDDTKRF
jgi:hypothetical protein